MFSKNFSTVEHSTISPTFFSPDYICKVLQSFKYIFDVLNVFFGLGFCFVLTIFCHFDVKTRQAGTKS